MASECWSSTQLKQPDSKTCSSNHYYSCFFKRMCILKKRMCIYVYIFNINYNWQKLYNLICSDVRVCVCVCVCVYTIYLFIFWLCRAACGILVPQPEVKPATPAVEAWSLNHWTTREVPCFDIYIYISWNHHHNQDSEHIHRPKFPHVLCNPGL